MSWIYDPWPWYVSGPLISLIMFLLLLMGKNFGMSSSLRTLCTICGAGKKTSFFDFDWKAQKWNLIVVIGAIIGGAFAAHFLTIDDSVHISKNTITELKSLGFKDAGAAYLPETLFDMHNASFKIISMLFVGGLLVGFGARYAGGCTSGHAISGLSNLQLPSLIAVIGFFIGGFITIYLVFPLLF